jgi:hypothetical protein
MIVSLADNEIPGIGAIGAHMEILLFHRFALTPHTPVTNAMTLDDTSGCKSRYFLNRIHAFSPESIILPNSRTANPFPGVSTAGCGERMPNIRGMFTATPVVTHRKGLPVRLFGEKEGGGQAG